MSSEKLSTEAYKGVRDFYPSDWSILLETFATIRKTLHSYGFEEYQASPLERSELYESKSSEEIVNEQTYTFEDRGGRSVTLRPEMTPTLARMVAGKRRELVFPLRWFSLPNVFRYERPQRGRLREHYQLNVDILGIKGADADGEILVIASTLMRAFGAKDSDFIIRVNSRTLLNAATAANALSEEDARDYLGLLDRKNKMTAAEFEEARARFRRNGKDPLEIIESGENAEVAREHTALITLIEAFRARGMTNVVFDATIVRGFLYYTGIVFEVYDTSPENPRALFGGGRYDNLVSLFGGDAIPAIGFGMGDVTLVDFLTTHNLLPKTSPVAHVLIGTPSDEDVAGAQTLAEELREKGLNVLVHTAHKPLGDQVREALRRGVPYFIAYGASEVASGMVKIKNLAKEEETEVSRNDIAACIIL